MLKPSAEAQRSVPLTTGPARSAVSVECKAMRDAIPALCGRAPEDRLLILGQHCLQFGRYQGQTFQWLLENALGYAGWVVADMSLKAEKLSDAPLSRNKFKLKVSSLFFCIQCMQTVVHYVQDSR